MNSEWLIRVYRDLPTGPDDVEIGTAYPIADKRVLVARHVVAEHRSDSGGGGTWHDIDTRKITLTWVNFRIDGDRVFEITPPKTEADKCNVEVIWDGRAWGFDVAILKCCFPDGVQIDSGLLNGQKPAEPKDWRSFGFAEAGLRQQKREPQSLSGKTEAYISGKTYHVGVNYPAKHPEGWRGLSGAPVFVNNKIEGIITDNVPPYGSGRIAAVPMFLLLQIPEFREAARLPVHERIVIDPKRFQDKIVAILERETSVLKLLNETLRHRDFEGKAISFSCGNGGVERCAVHLVENMFNDFESGKRLLQLALHECAASDDETSKARLHHIAYFYFPACYVRDESEIVLTEYRHGISELIDARAASVASIELRMAAIEGRAADYDPDQTRDDGPVGRKKIHDPPAFALEAMRTEEFTESLAKLLFQKTSGVQYKVKKYASFQDDINEQIAIGNDPAGSPYIVLNDPGDKRNRGLTEGEMAGIARELRSKYRNLFITYVSDDPNIIRRERKYLDWFWNTFSKK